MVIQFLRFITLNLSKALVSRTDLLQEKYIPLFTDWMTKTDIL
jgi:hypothetical protein